MALTGYHRKHAIRVLGSSMNTEPAATPPRERIYDEAVREALGMLWEAADRVCGKRLKPLLPTLVTALERHGHLTLDPAVRASYWESVWGVTRRSRTRGSSGSTTAIGGSALRARARWSSTWATASVHRDAVMWTSFTSGRLAGLMRGSRRASASAAEPPSSS